MKKSIVIGLSAASIGFLIGNQQNKNLVKEPVSIITFTIKVPFEQWAEGFDSKEAKRLHKANQIKPLFRGVSTKNPTKVVVIHQSDPDSVDRILTENKEMIEAGGHIMKTTRISNWSFD